MAPKIKNTGRPAGYVAVSIGEQPRRPDGEDRAAKIRRFLEEEMWPLVPPSQHGRRLSRAEENAILGYGEDRD